MGCEGEAIPFFHQREKCIANGSHVCVLGLAEPELVFPFSSPHGAVFYVGSWQGVDSTLVLWLLLSGAYTCLLYTSDAADTILV